MAAMITMVVITTMTQTSSLTSSFPLLLISVAVLSPLALSL